MADVDGRRSVQTSIKGVLVSVAIVDMLAQVDGDISFRYRYHDDGEPSEVWRPRRSKYYDRIAACFSPSPL